VVVDDAFLIELKFGFLDEAQELLSRVESLSLQLEKEPARLDLYAEFARLAHNFKGSGKAVGFEHISKMSHRLEDYILAIQNGKIAPDGYNLDFLFRCLDRLKADVEALRVNPELLLDHSVLIDEIGRRIEGRQTSAAMVQEVKSLPQNSFPDVAKDPNVVNHSAVHVDTSHKPVEVFRVPKNKLDSLLEIVGEQAILQSFLEQCKNDVDGNRELLIKTISQLSKLTSEIQSQALSLTLVQMTPLFTKLERATRDASRMCSKPIEIHVSGSETEIDKTLVDELIMDWKLQKNVSLLVNRNKEMSIS